MDSTNSQSAANSRVTNTLPYYDELQRCQQMSQIKARIQKQDESQAKLRQRKQRIAKNREQRLQRSRDVSLSISNNASAIFSTSKSRKVIDEQITKYENIAAITQQQNNNLKQQNQYLLAKLKKMKEKEKKFIKIAEKAQKYKQLYEEAMQQLQIVRQQCQSFKHKAEEMKKIALLDVGRLEDKILPFMKTLDDSGSVNSEAISRTQSKNVRRQLQSKYSKQL